MTGEVLRRHVTELPSWRCVLLLGNGPFAQFVDQFLKGTLEDDLLKLAPIVTHQADTIYDDIVSDPPTLLQKKTVIHGECRFIRSQLSSDFRVRTLPPFSQVTRVLFSTGIIFDSSGIRVGEKPLVNRDEFFLLYLRQRFPILAQDSLRHFGIVESICGDFFEHAATLRLFCLVVLRRVLEDVENLVDGFTYRLRRRFGTLRWRDDREAPPKHEYKRGRPHPYSTALPTSSDTSTYRV